MLRTTVSSRFESFTYVRARWALLTFEKCASGALCTKVVTNMSSGISSINQSLLSLSTFFANKQVCIWADSNKFCVPPVDKITEGKQQLPSFPCNHAFNLRHTSRSGKARKRFFYKLIVLCIRGSSSSNFYTIQRSDNTSRQPTTISRTKLRLSASAMH